MRKIKKILTKLIFFLTLTKLYLTFEVNTNCPSNQFYDTTLLECNICPDNMVPSKDGTNFFFKYYRIFVRMFYFRNNKYKFINKYTNTSNWLRVLS